MRLRDIAFGAALTKGIDKGRDAEHARRRLRVAEAREDQGFEFEQRRQGRIDERAALEHGDKVEGIHAERGAREAAREADTAPAAGSQGDPVQLGGPEAESQPATLGQADSAAPAGEAGPKRLGIAQDGEAGEGAEQAGDSASAGASSAAPATAKPARPKALWFRQAEAQRAYWEKQGRPERAAKATIEAYTRAFAEDEARFKFEIQPQEQKIRSMNLTAEELASDEKVRGLQQSSVMAKLSAAGKLWGLVKQGATADALRLFNNSELLQPGVKAESIRVMKATGPDGKVVDVMVLMDRNGEAVKDKEGNESIYPVSMLDRMHELATTSTVTLNKGQSMYRLKTDPATGATAATEVIRAPDPDAAARSTRDSNTRLDRLRQQGRQALKDSLFAGQTMMDKVDETKQRIHARAQPLVDKYVEQGATPGEAAARARREAEDAIKRESKGAGPAGEPTNGPTVKDIIGG